MKESLHLKSDYLAAGAALAAAFTFGISTPLSKVLISDLNPFLLAGLLYLGSGIGLLPVAISQLKTGHSLNWKKNFRLVAGMTIFGGFLGPVLLMSAVKLAPAASVSLWLNLELAATAFLGHFIFKDYLDKKAWLSVSISLAAGVLLSYGSGTAGASAGLLVALACLCWGLDNHLTALIDNLSPVQSTVIKGLFAGSTNFALGLMLSGQEMYLPVFGKAMLIGFICYGSSISLYIASAQKLGAVRGQLLFSIAPIFGVLVSALFLGETISPVQMASGIMLTGSVWYMLSGKHEHLHKHLSISHSHYHSHDDLHHNHHVNGGGRKHSHEHSHRPDEHSHPHWPDMHHRHDHS